MKISRLFHGILDDDSSELNELWKIRNANCTSNRLLEPSRAEEKKKKMYMLWANSFSDAAFIDGANSREKNKVC